MPSTILPSDEHPEHRHWTHGLIAGSGPDHYLFLDFAPAARFCLEAHFSKSWNGFALIAEGAKVFSLIEERHAETCRQNLHGPGPASNIYVYHAIELTGTQVTFTHAYGIDEMAVEEDRFLQALLDQCGSFLGKWNVESGGDGVDPKLSATGDDLASFRRYLGKD